MPDQLKATPNSHQRGSLNLMRYPGQSILIYPKDSSMGIAASDLFAEPIEIIVDTVSQNEGVYARIVADKRLVVVRNEIFRRNGNSFSPAPTLREDAYRRAFVELARTMMSSDLFSSLSEQAWNHVMQPNQVELGG